MKTSRFTLLVLLFCACQKQTTEAVTKPVEFNSTSYYTLGTFDESGKPNYLLPKDEITSDFLSFVKQNLPEKDLRTTNPALLESAAIADITIAHPSDVLITFVSQGSMKLTNAIGFYTYPTNNPPASTKDIKKITYVFPQAGAGTPLQAGDKVKIGRFDIGTSIGFVLLQKAWDTTTKSLNNKVVHFCSNDILNPEVDPKLKKHAVLLNYEPDNKMLIGFEDLNRTTRECDHDFNDIVIYATVTP